MTPEFRRRVFATRDWVFDLDNTLYPANSGFFDQIGERMTDYVSRTLGVDPAEALRLQTLYYETHGATLTGLIANHSIDPHDFLHFVHDIDATPHFAGDAHLAEMIARLPGRKFVFTNGSRGHADRVVKHLGLDGLFDAHFAIEDAEFKPKPHMSAFDRLITRHDITPSRALMVEDSPRNLEPAHALGFATVLVADGPHAAPHVHHVTESVNRFLSAALGDLGPR